MKTNCPNCGAPIEDIRCPYCNTIFYDFAALSLDEPVYIRIKNRGEIYMFKAVISNCDISIQSDTYDTYCGDRLMKFNMGNRAEVDVCFNVFPDEQGNLFRVEAR